MSDTLKQQLDSELSQIIRKYEDAGLSADEIGDSLYWHSELATSRQSTPESVQVQAD